MDLNKLVTKRIKEYALDGDVDLLDKYGFLFNMIANEYLEAINYTHCCKSDSEQLFCGGCGRKRELKRYSDLNSGRSCTNKLCKEK